LSPLKRLLATEAAELNESARVLSRYFIVEPTKGTFMSNSKDSLSFYTGWAMLIASGLLIIQWPLFALIDRPGPFPGGDLTLYLIMSAGCLLMAWGWVLIRASKNQEWSRLVALPTSIGFGFLAAMRYFAFGKSPELYQLVGAAPLLEAIGFTLLMALYFLKGSSDGLLALGNIPNTLSGRLLQLWHSYRQMPLWVQIWVGCLLMPVNMIAFFIMDTDIGRWAGLGFIFVLLGNGTILLTQARFSRAMAVPHYLPGYR